VAAFDPVLIEVHNAGPATGAGNNTYLVVEPGEEACLIDAGIGTPAHVADIRRCLDARGAQLTDVLVTHAHADHASGASVLQQAFGAPRFAKYPWLARDEARIGWRALSDGETLRVGGTLLVAIHTPGHAPDHLVFWHDPSRTLFGGDLVVAGSSVVIAWSRGGDLAAYLASLERVLALQPARLLPAHGPAVADPSRLLRKAIAHRLRREQQVLDAIGRGRDTVFAIADSIYDGLDRAMLPLARETVRAHLEKLKDEGQVAHEDHDRWRLSSA
jgi:glyoxylase-like metal-dependent hydrolase (beta-lactamase superfamily II)